MNHSRPKNLNLFTIQFPIPAIVSILHRVSGFVLFLLIPLLLWGLSYSFTFEGFNNLMAFFSLGYVKVFLWLCFVPFFFHLVAGIRHLLMDVHLGETLEGGRISSIVTFIIFFILVVLMGIWLW